MWEKKSNKFRIHRGEKREMYRNARRCDAPWTRRNARKYLRSFEYIQARLNRISFFRWARWKVQKLLPLVKLNFHMPTTWLIRITFSPHWRFEECFLCEKGCQRRRKNEKKGETSADNDPEYTLNLFTIRLPQSFEWKREETERDLRNSQH